MLECSSAVCDGWSNIVYNKAASFVSVSGGDTTDFITCWLLATSESEQKQRKFLLFLEQFYVLQFYKFLNMSCNKSVRTTVGMLFLF